MNKIGKRGEDLAQQFLLNNGYDIVKTNYHAGRTAEIDIIAQNADTLIFVEVKAAGSKNFGDPATWVDERKQLKIGQAAEIFLAQYETPNTNCRFDVITIDFSQKPEKITHIQNAFML